MNENCEWSKAKREKENDVRGRLNECLLAAAAAAAKKK